MRSRLTPIIAALPLLALTIGCAAASQPTDTRLMNAEPTPTRAEVPTIVKQASERIASTAVPTPTPASPEPDPPAATPEPTHPMVEPTPEATTAEPGTQSGAMLAVEEKPEATPPPTSERTSPDESMTHTFDLSDADRECFPDDLRQDAAIAESIRNPESPVFETVLECLSPDGQFQIYMTTVVGDTTELTESQRRCIWEHALEIAGPPLEDDQPADALEHALHRFGAALIAPTVTAVYCVDTPTILQTSATPTDMEYAAAIDYLRCVIEAEGGPAPYVSRVMSDDTEIDLEELHREQCGEPPR